MAIDLTKPIWIVAVVQPGPNGDRLAVMGGSNDEGEARLTALMLPHFSLLRCEVVPAVAGDDAATVTT